MSRFVSICQYLSVRGEFGKTKPNLLSGSDILREPISGNHVNLKKRTQIACKASIFIGLAIGLTSRTWAQNQNWPVFRGTGAGVVEGNPPAEWDGPSGKNIIWKTAIPLPGKNSPIIWNGSIFLSGASKEKQEVYCIDAQTGVVKWTKTVGTPDPAKAPKIMEDTGYAAATMTTDGQRVFAMFATGDLVALDFSGNIVWNKALGVPDNQYGLASSLIMWKDRLIVQFDQGLEPDSGKSALLAFESATGNIIWKTPRAVANSWTSPILVSTSKGDQIITAANPFVIAYEPEKGTELWRSKCHDGDVAPSPAFANGLALVAMESLGTAIKVDGSGNVSKTHIAWEIEQNLGDIVSPVMTKEFALTVVTYGTVTCYDAVTGKKLWEHEFDGPFHASPLVIGNVVFLIDRTGLMHRFEAGREFKLLNKLPLGEPVSATPAAVNERLYIRGEKHLYAIGQK